MYIKKTKKCGIYIIDNTKKMIIFAKRLSNLNIKNYVKNN